LPQAGKINSFRQACEISGCVLVDAPMVKTFVNLSAIIFCISSLDGPTHRAGNKLDLLFCNRTETLSDVLTLSCDEHSFPTDHYTIKFLIPTKFRKAKPVRRTVYDCNRANFPKLCIALSQTDLRVHVSLSDNIDDCWEHWKDLFLSVVSRYVPTKVV
jgi:hypothetical protein